jgi:hypothetical protein
MKKGKILVVALIGLLMAYGLALAGCDSIADALFSSAANANSSSTQAGQIYYFYNQSSYTVTVMDSTGNRVIPPGGSTQIRYNKDVSINSVNYSPSNLVYPTQSSGTHITFLNR